MSVSTKDICADVDNGIKSAKNLPESIGTISPLPKSNPSDSEILDWLNQIKSNANTANSFINTELPNLLTDVKQLEQQLNEIFS